jgi:ribosomal protein S27E
LALALAAIALILRVTHRPTQLHRRSAEMVKVTCPSCKRVHVVEESLLGRQMRCQGCQHVFEAPRPGAGHASPPGDASPAAVIELIPAAEPEEQTTRTATAVPVARPRRRPPRSRAALVAALIVLSVLAAVALFLWLTGAFGGP